MLFCKYGNYVVISFLLRLHYDPCLVSPLLLRNQRTRPARLVEGHLRLTLHSSLAGLGALHSVLSRRRGKVVTDAMVDGTDLIQVTATIPQAESFVSLATFQFNAR